MGMRPEEKYKGNDGPGPGSYGVKGTFSHVGGKWGSGKRDNPLRNSDAPGPGSYNYGGGNKGGFAMGKAPRSAGGRRADAPGPG
jgi:hypothetical protein